MKNLKTLIRYLWMFFERLRIQQLGGKKEPLQMKNSEKVSLTCRREQNRSLVSPNTCFDKFEYHLLSRTFISILALSLKYCAQALKDHVLFWCVVWQLISLLINWTACRWCGEVSEWQYFKVTLKSVQWTLVPGPTAAELNCLQLKQQQVCVVSLQPVYLNLWLWFLLWVSVCFAKCWKVVLAGCFLHITMHAWL